MSKTKFEIGYWATYIKWYDMGRSVAWKATGGQNETAGFNGRQHREDLM
jgi:hypothetical protein